MKQKSLTHPDPGFCESYIGNHVSFLGFMLSEVLRKPSRFIYSAYKQGSYLTGKCTQGSSSIAAGGSIGWGEET